MIKRFIPVGVAVLLIAVCIFIGFRAGLLDKYTYSDDTMNMNDYFQIFSEDAVPIILADEIIEDQGILRDGQYYFSMDTVKEYINSRFYFDQGGQQVLYTTPTDFYSISLDSQEYTINDELSVFDCPIAITSGEKIYLSITFLEQFSNFQYEVFEQPNRMQLYLESDTAQTATIKKDTALRYQGGVKSEVLRQLSEGDQVVVLETMETWSKVKSEDALIGYVENKRLEEAGTIDRTVQERVAAPEYTSIHKDYVINMVWHQVTNATANGGVTELLAATKGVNTISPTWFALSDSEGNFTSLADASYVEQMHSSGMEVWALIDNFTNKAEVDTAAFLANTAARKNLITQLVQQVQEYGIDGINVDFEEIPLESGEDYIQFLRELSIACRQNQIVLSVDNYVPTGYTAHYDRQEQGIVVDYVIIMGYDEHYSTSEEAGSVASINYVEQGIADTVEVVPSEKVINGIPFYTRIWDVTGVVSSEAVGMQSAQDFLAKYEITAVWDDVTCQNVAAFSTVDKNYEIWLEDAQSIGTKLNVMSRYNLAGVAAWKLGLETSDIWDVIQEYVNTATQKASQETEQETAQETEQETVQETEQETVQETVQE